MILDTAHNQSINAFALYHQLCDLIEALFSHLYAQIGPGSRTGREGQPGLLHGQFDLVHGLAWEAAGYRLACTEQDSKEQDSGHHNSSQSHRPCRPQLWKARSVHARTELSSLGKELLASL
jgi:hypothetical protein